MASKLHRSKIRNNCRRKDAGLHPWLEQVKNDFENLEKQYPDEPKFISEAMMGNKTLNIHLREIPKIKSVIYISGPMTGIKNFNFPAFNKAARTLRKLGYRVFNPAETDGGDTRRLALH